MGLKEHLQAIYETHGVLTTQNVVATARDVTHPLHHRFEWDDSVAGERYREVQAAALIRSVRVSYAKTDESDEESYVRAFHSVEQPTGSSYLPIEAIADDPFTRELLLRTAEREWKQMRRRYSHLSEFFVLVRNDLAANE